MRYLFQPSYASPNYVKKTERKQFTAADLANDLKEVKIENKSIR